MRDQIGGEEPLDDPHVTKGLCIGHHADLVGHTAQMIEFGAHHAVLGPEPGHERLGLGVESHQLRAGEHRPQRIEDHGHVDRLLQKRAPDRRQVPGGGHAHRHEREADAEDHTLAGETKRPSCDGETLGQPIESIDDEHHIGDLRRRRHTAGADGHPDVGERERRRVIEPITDHEGVSETHLLGDDIELPRRRALGEHRIDAEHRTDGLGHISSVTGDHDHPADAARAHGPDRARSVGAQPILEEDRADRGAVHGDIHRERAVERGAATGPCAPR